MATPDIYACSPLDDPSTSTSTSESASTIEAKAPLTATTAKDNTTHAHIGGVASRRGWGRLDGDAAPRYRQRIGGQILEGIGQEEGGEELPSAVLISRSIKHDPAACTFEIKVSINHLSIIRATIHLNFTYKLF